MPTDNVLTSEQDQAAERVANSQAKTLVNVPPMTSDGSGTLQSKSSSKLPAGKTFNEAAQATSVEVEVKEPIKK